MHLFSGGEPHCLSALEGLDGPPQELTLIGRSNRIERRGGRIDAVTQHGARTAGRDVALSFEGEEGTVHTLGIDAAVGARDPFFWIRVPRVLTYFTQSGTARVILDGATRDGFGLIEHAWGARTRLDVAHLAPRRWQWDVLSLGGSRFFASLAFTGAGVGAHGAARIDEGGPLVRVRRFHVQVLDWSVENCGAQRSDSRRSLSGAWGAEPPISTDGGRSVPARWKGTMVTGAGALRYEARAVTPVSPEVDGGGFLGFTWEGELRGSALSGAGFCEYRAG